MKQLLVSLTFSLFFIFSLVAQETSSKWDFRLGFGQSFLGSGDIWTNMVENELNYKFNRYFATSISLAYAKGEDEGRHAIGGEEILHGISSFWQTNLNIYFSPLQNIRKDDIRIGIGASAYRISDFNANSVVFPLEDESRNIYALERRNAIGGMLLIEYTRTINKKWLIGTRAFTQPYLNGDINSGVLIKFGMCL